MNNYPGLKSVIRARNLVFAVAAGITSTIDMVFDAAQRRVDKVFAKAAKAAKVIDPKRVAKAQYILKTMMVSGRLRWLYWY